MRHLVRIGICNKDIEHWWEYRNLLNKGKWYLKESICSSDWGSVSCLETRNILSACPACSPVSRPTPSDHHLPPLYIRAFKSPMTIIGLYLHHTTTPPLHHHAHQSYICLDIMLYYHLALTWKFFFISLSHFYPHNIFRISAGWNSISAFSKLKFTAFHMCLGKTNTICNMNLRVKYLWQ